MAGPEVRVDRAEGWQSQVRGCDFKTNTLTSLRVNICLYCFEGHWAQDTEVNNWVWVCGQGEIAEVP